MENREARLQDMEGIKEYLSILKGNDKTRYMTVLFSHIFEAMDQLKNSLGMAFMEMECVQKKAEALPDGMEKNHAIHALDVAAEGIGAAFGHFSRAEYNIAKGVEDSMAGFKNGNSKPLERPFPILKTKKELEELMKALVDPFATVDRAVGRMEDGAKDPVFSRVFWPMRTLEQLIRQTYDRAHATASWVDDLRPKAHQTVKKEVLEPGIFWEKEKRERVLEMKEQRMPKAEEKDRTSLRERLAVAKIVCQYPGDVPAKEHKDRQMQL